MKARTRAGKRGRPRKADALRTKDGTISESISQFQRDAISWKRQRDNPGIEPVALLGPEYGSVIHSWRSRAERAGKRTTPDQPAGFIFTEQHLDTASRLHEVYANYSLAIGSKSPRSASDFGGAGGHDNLDPFEADRARRDERAISAYVGTLSANGQRHGGLRRIILEAGPFCMMAVETVIYENRDCPDMLPDLRTALNAVERSWRMARAA